MINVESSFIVIFLPEIIEHFLIIWQKVIHYLFARIMLDHFLMATTNLITWFLSDKNRHIFKGFIFSMLIRYHLLKVQFNEIVVIEADFSVPLVVGVVFSVLINFLPFFLTSRTTIGIWFIILFIITLLISILFITWIRLLVNLLFLLRRNVLLRILLKKCRTRYTRIVFIRVF